MKFMASHDEAAVGQLHSMTVEPLTKSCVSSGFADRPHARLRSCFIGQLSVAKNSHADRWAVATKGILNTSAGDS
jgi:hypothetical protein